MRATRAILCGAVSVLFMSSGLPVAAEFSAQRTAEHITVAGDHFRITVDLEKGGEIADIRLFDGSTWNRVLGADGQTCPMVKISQQELDCSLVHDCKPSVAQFEANRERVRFQICGTPCTADGRPSPWTVGLTYEIYAEGAVFVDVAWDLPRHDIPLAAASVSVVLDRTVAKSPRYHEENVRHRASVPESVRVAFGTNPEKSYTNEIEALLESKVAMAGAMAFRGEAGNFTWSLADGSSRSTGPWHYRNRLALALGSAATGKPRSNVIGQRVYHWVNWYAPYLRRKDTCDWWPSFEQMDKMAANRCTMLIFHHYWMQRAGDNGHPHADYRHPRDPDALKRMIAYAHSKGMRVGLYMRGIERYAVPTGFFDKYCKRNWDGVYVDWHGPAAVACHEATERPEAALSDTHASTDGTYLPGRDYFLFTRQLRQMVGKRGFLIGHTGPDKGGALANLVFDAYLPGEASVDHDMLDNPDTATWKGMTGGGVCMPWTPDSARYRSPEGIAKMAAWGFYPHVCLGLQRRRDLMHFPLEPDAPENTFLLPYWRVLAAIDVERSAIYNSPSENIVAARCEDPRFHCVVYKESPDTYLVIVANFGVAPGRTVINLAPSVLGMSGEYRLSHVASQTGAVTVRGTTSTRIATSTLPQWGFEGWKLGKP